LNQLANDVEFMMSVEMNAGQMVEDVRLAVEGKVPVYFTGRMGGMITTPDEVLEKIESTLVKQDMLQD
jgi:2-oxoglutarate ferredoxin oxidoreductase subunit alpha